MATSAGTPPPPSPPSCPAPSSPGSRELVAGLAPILQYCQAHSSPPHPALRDLQEFTMARGNSRMLAAPEVLALNSLLIKVSGARVVLDVGVFTGASSLAAALAVGEGGRVEALERSRSYGEVARRFWAQAGVEERVTLHLGHALDTLHRMVQEGGRNTVDFAFIDADKGNYTAYYHLCLELVRPGGMVVLDNTLFRGHVVKDWCPDNTVQSIQAANEVIAGDARVESLMLPVGDGCTLVVKR